MMPLYGHTSQETAYLVIDYPYGFKLRCQIRFWLESHPKKGYRLCSQTTNPKKPGEVWNAPRRSTYTPIAAAMYLDDAGHVQWATFADWKPEAALSFVQRFPHAAGIDSARIFAALKVRRLAGKRLTINGAPAPYTEADRERDAAELAIWRQVVDALAASRAA
jgi:hypothetical protein